MAVIERVLGVAGPRTAGLVIKPHVVALQRPTHMEWTPDGRLLLSEHRGGAVKDVTEPGDARDMTPVAYGLAGPAALLPIGDRILVTEMLGGRVTDIASGGDVSASEPFASGLRLPYNIVGTPDGDATRIIASEDVSLGISQYTDITNGGERADFRPFITGMPGRTHYHAVPVIDYERLGDTPWEDFDFVGSLINGSKCGSWGIVYTRGGSRELFVAASSLGLIARAPSEGGEFLSIVADADRVFAWGLDAMGGMKEHPSNGLVYVSQPLRGCVVAVDPNRQHNYVFDPPVLELPRPGFPSCIRFTPDGETMFVCDAGNGVVWRVEGFAY